MRTMTAPPPNGRSSTVRCASSVHARGSWTRTSISPDSRARPTSAALNAPERYSGNSENTSMRIVALVLQVEEAVGEVDDDDTGGVVDDEHHRDQLPLLQHEQVV